MSACFVCQGCADSFESDVNEDADVVMGVCFSLGIVSVSYVFVLVN